MLSRCTLLHRRARWSIRSSCLALGRWGLYLCLRVSWRGVLRGLRLVLVRLWGLLDLGAGIRRLWGLRFLFHEDGLAGTL
jgi:hypothetical protein